MPKKIYIVECSNSGGFMSNRPTRYSYQEGTLIELIKAYSYTLECGASWENERDNKKINRNPKTIKSLLINLNNAVNNSASNGYAGKSFNVVTKKIN